jgi:hypothetical protein
LNSCFLANHTLSRSQIKGLVDVVEWPNYDYSKLKRRGKGENLFYSDDHDRVYWSASFLAGARFRLGRVRSWRTKIRYQTILSLWDH